MVNRAVEELSETGDEFQLAEERKRAIADGLAVEELDDVFASDGEGPHQFLGRNSLFGATAANL
jgi:hypothetical protein